MLLDRVINRLDIEEHSTCAFCGGSIWRVRGDDQWWHEAFCQDFCHIARRKEDVAGYFAKRDRITMMLQKLGIA